MDYEALITFIREYGKDITLAVLGILGGGIVSLFFYRRSLQRAEISYACEYTRLIWSRIPAFSNITLTHNDERLHDPRRVLFYIWNSGNTSLEGSQIAAADPLHLAAGDVRIINVAILRVTRDVISASTQFSSGANARVSFDYLDPGDGFVIEALYDVVAKDNYKNTCPLFSGTIKA